MQVRQLLDFARQHGGFRNVLRAVGLGALSLPGEPAPLGLGNLGTDDFSLTDQAAGKAGCATVFGGRAAEDQRVATVLHNRSRHARARRAAYRADETSCWGRIEPFS